MPHIFPNSSQGPFPKIAGKGPVMETTSLIMENHGKIIEFLWEPCVSEI